MQKVWSDVDVYFGRRLEPRDPVLQAVLDANAEAGLPPHDVSRLQGKFLDLLVRIAGAKRVLEIGTLGGYSTIWFARAVGPEGRVVTIEADPRHAGVARANLDAAGVADRVALKVGKALDVLPELEGDAPFDLVFIDADKANTPGYLAWALRLARPGTVIVVDNVVRKGEVLDETGTDPDVEGVRRTADMIRDEPRLSATALQTVGVKGHDGFILALVTG
jgi:predicted O-methyltransferase YrrM